MKRTEDERCPTCGADERSGCYCGTLAGKPETADSLTPAASDDVGGLDASRDRASTAAATLNRLESAMSDALAHAGFDAVRVVLAEQFEALDRVLTEDARRAGDVLAGVPGDAPELPERLREIAATRVESMRALYLGVMLRTPINLARLGPSFVALARLQHETARINRAMAEAGDVAAKRARARAETAAATAASDAADSLIP